MVQYLVGVGVSDTAEEGGIGEGALQCVILAPKALGDLRRARREDLDARRRQAEERGLPTHEMKARPFLAARLREDERARFCRLRALGAGRSEVERGEADFPGDACASGFPPE